MLGNSAALSLVADLERRDPRRSMSLPRCFKKGRDISGKWNLQGQSLDESSSRLLKETLSKIRKKKKKKKKKNCQHLLGFNVFFTQG